MRFPKQVSIKTFLITVLIAIFLSALVFAQTPSSTFTISPGVFPGAPSFTIWKEGSYYFAKDANGQLAYTGSNFTALVSNCIANLPSYGGKIFLRTNDYEGTVIINRSNVILEGEGAYDNIPVGPDPGKAPTWLKGTVIKPLENQHGIYIQGANRTNIQIRNLGIWFTSASTGDGIRTEMATQDFCLKGAVIENIKILGHDKDSYALAFSNFLFLNVKHIQAYGGPLMRLYSNLPYFTPGNSVFDDLYCEITYDLNPIAYTTGPYPLFVHVNDSLAGYPWYQIMNLIHMRRIQINNPTAQTDADYYSAVFWALKWSTIEGLNIEGVTSTANAIMLGSCYNVQFINTFVWAQATNAIINSASTNQHITWISPYISGNVQDFNNTNMWINPTITGTIHQDTSAGFEGLVGNQGVGTILNGQSSVTISATFVGQKDRVLLTVIDGDNQTYGVKVESINYAPTSTFVVKLTDESSTSADYSFYWEVRHNYGS